MHNVQKETMGFFNKKKKIVPDKYEHTRDDLRKNYFVKNICNKLYVLSEKEVAIRLNDGRYCNEYGDYYPKHFLMVPFLRFAFEFMRAVGTVNNNEVKEWDRFHAHELDKIMIPIPEPFKFMDYETVSDR